MSSWCTLPAQCHTLLVWETDADGMYHAVEKVAAHSCLEKYEERMEEGPGMVAPLEGAVQEQMNQNC